MKQCKTTGRTKLELWMQTSRFIYVCKYKLWNKDSNTEIFCQLLRAGEEWRGNGGGMERKLHHDFKQLYQELARWFALVVHPVNCLVWLFPDISWKSNKKKELTCTQKVSPLLATQELGFVLHYKSQHPFLNTNLLCKSLDILPWISQNMPLWWINKCSKLVVYNVKKLGSLVPRFSISWFEFHRLTFALVKSS